MLGNRTFSIIKPKAVKSGYIIPILSKIHEAGFKLIAMRFTQLTKNQAQGFYAIHKGKAFYDMYTSPATMQKHLYNHKDWKYYNED